jgi:hypothetical protein
MDLISVIQNNNKRYYCFLEIFLGLIADIVKKINNFNYRIWAQINIEI